MLAAFVFSFSLGFRARLLAPVYARPVEWCWLDGGVAFVMFSIAGWLAFG